MALQRIGPSGSLFSTPQVAAAFADEFLSTYANPAFGAHSKTEIDLLVFDLMIKAGIVDPKAQAFEISKLLTVPPSKVKSLVQAWYLRNQPTDAELVDEIVSILISAKFLSDGKDGRTIKLTISNRFVREYFSSRLQKIHHTVDGSFNSEIVCLSPDALAEFMATEAKDSAETVAARLVEFGIIADKSATGVMTEIVMKLAGKIGDKAVSELAGGIVGSFSSFVKGLFKGNTDTATDAAKVILT
ncbi:hypothetical protein [Prosthecomicrobium hirschii]|nr:hypothetical protein [Prosthecomicrobium hirschii]